MPALTVKVTEECNSNCRYCGVSRRRRTDGSMAPAVLERLLRRTDEYLTAYPEETVEILWHGGEPLLPGPEFYQSVLDFLASQCSTTRSRIRHVMQTNLTCWEEGFAPVLRGLGIQRVGTSFDPEPHVRGPGPETDSDVYNSRFLRGLEALECSGFDWDLLYVVTKRSLARPLDLFFCLSNLRLGGGLSLNPVLVEEGAPEDLAISPREYAEFLGAIFPHWWKHRIRYPAVLPFELLIARVVEGRGGPECMEFGVCGSRPDRLVVWPDGSVTPSGRKTAGRPAWRGSLMEEPLEEVLRRCTEPDASGEECERCRLRAMCRGNGLENSSRSVSIEPDEWCVARRAFVEEYLEPITGVCLGHAA